jgi:transposase-like protein
MLKDTETPRYAVRRTERIYSAQTKAELLAACSAPGASIAAIASAHGMNVNVLHRSLRASPQSRRSERGSTDVCDAGISDLSVPRFISVPLLAKPTEPVAREITVEIQRVWS